MRLVVVLLIACVNASCSERYEVAGEPAGSEPAGSESAGGAAPVEACVPGQAVLARRVSNARDLGGTPLSVGTVACGRIYRGPPLSALSNEGCAEVAELGLRTLVDLRVESERDAKPNSPCVDATRVAAPLPVPYERSAADYLDVLHAPAMVDVFHTFADATAYPIYFHCTFGRDRTGVVAALLLLALGAQRDEVMQEYLLSDASVGSSPESLDAVLDELELGGGGAAILSGIGISDDELAALSELLVSSE